jgi:ABC-type nickel/cobalt efflux system permease component RcnA
VIGAVLAGLVYWLLARYTEHAVRWFTVVATEIMHIVSGAWVLWALLRLAREAGATETDNGFSPWPPCLRALL